ncbi:hypothetical protein F4703DRAFT_1798040 [Phycomyces blakesleeanus]
MPLSCLPYEINRSIAEKISRHDQAVCASTSRAWHAPFFHTLWSNVELQNDRQLKYFIDANMSPSIPGCLVRTLSLFEWLDISSTDLRRLQYSCQELNYLSLPNVYDFALDIDTINGWNQWNSLLELEFYRDTLEIEALHSILTCMPALRLLHLPVKTGESTISLSLKDINRIHSKLPDLEDFFFEGQLAALSNEDTSYLTPSLKKTRLTSLKIIAIIPDTRWLLYWIYKHPNLHTLHMNVDKTEVIETIDWRAPVKIFLNEVGCCRKLQSMKLHGSLFKFWQYQTFFESLRRADITLKRLDFSIDISHIQEPIPAAIETFTYSSTNTLTHLGLDISGNGTCVQEIITLLGDYKNLSDLRISGQKLFLPLNIILDTCMSLKNIELNVAEITLCQQPNIQESKLRSITITNSRVHANVFNHISVRCPDLSEMHLLYASVIDHASLLTKRMHIYMPFTAFDTLRIHYTYFMTTGLSALIPEHKMNILSLTRMYEFPTVTDRVDNSRMRNTHTDFPDEKWYYISDLNDTYHLDRCQRLNFPDISFLKEYYASTSDREVPDFLRLRTPSPSLENISIVQLSESAIQGYFSFHHLRKKAWGATLL